MIDYLDPEPPLPLKDGGKKIWPLKRNSNTEHSSVFLSVVTSIESPVKTRGQRVFNGQQGPTIRLPIKWQIMQKSWPREGRTT